MADMTCLAEGLVVPADFNVTGLNLNEIIVGPTGCGKSFSNAYSRLVHTTNSSVVIPIAKKGIKTKFYRMFKERGYKVIDLNLACPEECEIGYDPMDYINRDEDVIQLARNLVGADPSKDKQGHYDPYWNDSATSILAALIALVRLNAKYAGQKASFANVIKLYRSLNFSMRSELLSSNLDVMFKKAEELFPGNQATELWKTINGLAPRTASCIISIVNNAIDKIFTDNIIRLTEKEDHISLTDLGKEKVALFITTSPMNTSLQNYVNILYADMFRSLFELAESNENSSLNVPVHIICDDFACGSKIVDFEDYISIFRAAGISVTMLLQSETQLSDMYGKEAATTIINNCDTYVYMGGMDIETCENISKRVNKPLHKVMSMPLEEVIVFRRGSEPYVSRRYQILSDPMYIQVMEDLERNNDSFDR